MATRDLKVLRAKDNPRHHTLGRFYTFWPFGSKGIQTYYCDSWVKNAGYWMTNVNDPTDRRNISERAINRTYHEVLDITTPDRMQLAAAILLYQKNVKPIEDELDPLAGF